MKINEKIKKLRMEKKMTQEKLAEKMNVSRQIVGQWERGEIEPRANNLESLASIFDVTVDYLFNEKEGIDDNDDFIKETCYSIKEDKTSKNILEKILMASCILSGIILFGAVCIVAFVVIISHFYYNEKVDIIFDRKLIIGLVFLFSVSINFIVTLLFFIQKKRKNDKIN